VYVRQAQDQELNLIVSGKLWRDALVMMDKETESLWSQISGKAFRGEWFGESLEPYPSEMTTWGEWVKAHPETEVLFKSEGEREQQSVYNKYFGDQDKLGIFGRKVDDRRLPPKTRVVAVEAGGASMVFPIDQLPENKPVSAQLGNISIEVVPTGAGGYHAYETTGDGKQGDQLRAHVVFWFGWVSFYPQAKVWNGG
jgi:hypothetical protein